MLFVTENAPDEPKGGCSIENNVASSDLAPLENNQSMIMQELNSYSEPEMNLVDVVKFSKEYPFISEANMFLTYQVRFIYLIVILHN